MRVDAPMDSIAEDYSDDEDEDDYKDANDDEDDDDDEVEEEVVDQFNKLRKSMSNHLTIILILSLPLQSNRTAASLSEMNSDRH